MLHPLIVHGTVQLNRIILDIILVAKTTYKASLAIHKAITGGIKASKFIFRHS